jgi:hypothetical protein
MAREFEAGNSTNPWDLFVLAETWALIGEPELAIAALEKAYEAGYTDRYYALIDPMLAAIADHPEMDRLAPPV